MKEEVWAPARETLIPYVSVVPKNFKYEIKGSLESWKSYGNWHYRLLDGLSELPEEEINTINQAIANITSKEEKIKTLYHFLQNECRYINVSIGTGGLKPFPASYVAKNKYGDCKALTFYLKSMLDYLNINSYYTIVKSGSPIQKINKNFPSQQFNHVILYIPSKEKDLWLDCTSKGPFNYLGTFTQNRYAFIIDNEKSRFTKTPALTPQEVLENRKINIEYNSNKADIQFSSQYRGNMFEKLLEIKTNYNKTSQKRILQNFFVENGFELKDFEIIKFDRDSSKIDLNYSAISNQIFKIYGNDVFISSFEFSLPELEKPSKRESPIQIDYPIYKKDTITYSIPKGYKLNNKIRKFRELNKFGKYEFCVQESGDKIILIKTLLINSGHYPKSEYDDFYRFYEKIIDINNKRQLVLKKT